MKKLVCIAMCLCALLLTTMSCSSESEKSSKTRSELIGKWIIDTEKDGVRFVSIVDYKSNGWEYETFAIKSDFLKIDIRGDMKGRWFFSNDVITYKVSRKDIHFSKYEIEGYTEKMIEREIEKYKSFIVNSDSKVTDVKIKGDKLTGLQMGREVSMTRTNQSPTFGILE